MGKIIDAAISISERARKIFLRGEYRKAAKLYFLANCIIALDSKAIDYFQENYDEHINQG